MRWGVIVVGFALVLPIYGQQKGTPTARQQDTSNDPQKPAPYTSSAKPAVDINVISQESTQASCDGASKRSESYFARLFSSENLPNIALVIAGFLGIGVAVRTLKILRRQTKITEDTLVLTQRPRIVVRMFYFSEVRGVGAIYDVRGGMRAGSFCNGQFYIDNCGGTDARIREIYSTVYIAEKLPMKRPYEGQEGSKEEKTLRPGASTFYLFQRMEPLDGPTYAEIAEFNIKGIYRKNFYVLGWIGYTDDLGIYRITAFCRRYDPTKERFVPVDDPDYEYAD